MKRLTLKRSLELCLELWSWLRDHPDMTAKLEWPKWNRYGSVFNMCFACEYDILEYEKQKRKGFHIMACSVCPLKGLWGTDCTRDSSPYNKWCNAKTDKSRQKNAGIIVDFCDKELKKLDGEVNKNAKKN